MVLKEILFCNGCDLVPVV